MESPPSAESAPRCPGCETPLPPRAAICPFCGEKAPRRDDSRTVGRALLWLVKAYRTWSLGLFAYAVMHLFLVGKFQSYFVLFLVAFPFGMALAVSYAKGDATPRGIVAFLILVDLGVIIAPAHQILPMLNLFPDLPKTQNRILTWYFAVYFLLQFVLAPPYVFFGSLRTAWRGGRPPIALWICLFGLATWSFIVFLVTVFVVRALQG